MVNSLVFLPMSKRRFRNYSDSIRFQPSTGNMYTTAHTLWSLHSDFTVIVRTEGRKGADILWDLREDSDMKSQEMKKALLITLQTL